MRGVAAMAVVVFHFMEIIITDFSKNFIAHGFLAVDFFFCLSGFVVAHAYDKRVEHMSVSGFLKYRLKRLHPLVLLGSLLGLLAFLFDPFTAASARYSVLQIAALYFFSSLLVPYPVMEDRYFNLFGLNAPSWSLFWEYVGNVLYAFLLAKLPGRRLLTLGVLSAAVIVFIAVTSGSLIGGWDGSTFWHGGARMLFSFLAGMCILRYRLIWKNRIGFIGMSLLLAAAFLVPYDKAGNWFVEPLIVIVYFPLLISLGAGSTIHPGHESLCKLSGDLSYPLYITHYFVMWIFGSYFNRFHPPVSTLVLVVMFLFLVQLSVAYLSFRYFDQPVRRKFRD